MSDPAVLPATAAQTGIWFAQLLEPQSCAYNTGEYVEILGDVDPDALRRALTVVLEEAYTLRARLAERDGTVVQVIGPMPEQVLTVHDTRGEPDPVAAAGADMRAALGRPTDLSSDALVGFALYRVGEQRWLWLHRYHHAVVDGYTVALLARRVAEIYTGLVAGTGTGDPLPDPALLVADEREYAASERAAADRGFWSTELAGLPDPVSLSAVAPTTATSVLRNSDALTHDDALMLRELAREAEVPWPCAVVAATAAYIGRMTGADEVVLGLPVGGRAGRLGRTTPGMVSNVLPLRLRVPPDGAVGELLRDTSAAMRRAMRHQRHRYEDIRRDLRLTTAGQPLVAAEVNLMMFDYELRFGTAPATAHNLSIGPADDLAVLLYDRGEAHGIGVEFDANPDRYDAAQLREHQRRYLAFAARLGRAGAGAVLGTVPVTLPEDELAVAASAAGVQVPESGLTLVDLMRSCAEAGPGLPAVVFEGTSLTYAELTARAGQLAAVLAGQGVGRESRVALMVPRSLELMVSLVAVLSLGAAYVPIDPGLPAERIGFMLSDSGPAAVLSLAATAHAIPSGTQAPVIVLDEPGTIDRLAAARPPAGLPAPLPGTTAYLIYTSGSTGRPKCVAVPHRGIVNRLLWMQGRYGLTPEDRVLQKTPAGFDVSVWEFFWPLIVGCPVVLARPDGHRDPVYLAELIRSERITTLHFVPSMLATFLAEPAAQGCTSLTRVICSGEALPRPVVERFHELVPATLHNLYGPTEAAVDVTSWECPAGEQGGVPIGLPVWNTSVHVLDAGLNPLPEGVTGELYLAGVQLARGYLNRPALSAERFVADPLSADGARMYRTGDLARWEGGTLHYVGRADDQVKIRGQRVELGEIQAAVEASASVSRAAVIVREDRPGDQQVVAYVVPAAGATIDAAAVRAACADSLPAHMVPAAVVPLADIPTTANGKLDRRALPAPDHGAAVEAVSPRSPREQLLCELFAEVLGLARVGITDNFFEIGGHSLLASRLVARVRETFGAELTIRSVFSAPTVELLAGRIAAYGQNGGAATKDDPLEVLLPLRPFGDGAPLFCIHPAGGLAWCYAGLIRHLPVGTPVYGLQARGLDGVTPLPADFEAMVEDYLEQMRSVRPHGPYHLLGYSSGGVLAHMIASRLEAAGEQVGLVAILDTYPGQELPELDEQAVLLDLLNWVGYDKRYVGNRRLDHDKVMTVLRRLGSSMATLAPENISAIARVYANNRSFVHGCAPPVFGGDVTVVVATLDKVDISPTPETWRPYVAGHIHVRRLDRRHNDLMKPGPLGEVGEVLAAELARIGTGVPAAV